MDCGQDDRACNTTTVDQFAPPAHWDCYYDARDPSQVWFVDRPAWNRAALVVVGVFFVLLVVFFIWHVRVGCRDNNPYGKCMLRAGSRRQSTWRRPVLSELGDGAGDGVTLSVAGSRVGSFTDADTAQRRAAGGNTTDDVAYSALPDTIAAVRDVNAADDADESDDD